MRRSDGINRGRRYRFRPGACIRLLGLCAMFACGMVLGISLWGGGPAEQAPAPREQQTTTGTTTPAPPVSGLTVRTLTGSEIQQKRQLVVVNKWNLWPQDEEGVELVSIRTYQTTNAYSLKDSAMRANREAVQAFDKMMRRAKTEGIQGIVITSSYRGYEKQRILFEQQTQLMRTGGRTLAQAEELANRTVSRPGESEHHTGYAFDLKTLDTEMEAFGTTEQGKWIQNNSAKFGFILRYPEDKAGYTGIDSEPWHIRYVGVEAAQAMQRQNQCLEEYVLTQ